MSDNGRPEKGNFLMFLMFFSHLVVSDSLCLSQETKPWKKWIRISFQRPLPSMARKRDQDAGPTTWPGTLQRDLLTSNKQLSSLMAESEQKLKSLDEGERQE